MSGYLKSKSATLLERGVEAYRRSDFFKHPPSDLTLDERSGLLSAARQIKEGKGFVVEKPVVDVSLNHLFVLAHCFHFEIENVHSVVTDGVWRDTLSLLHVVSSISTTRHS